MINFFPVRPSLFAKLIALVLMAASVDAATIAVTNTNDALAGSLRQAIQDANSGDTILFNIPTSDPGYNAATKTWTIGLTSSTLTISRDLSIDAAGQRITVKRTVGNAVPYFGVFNITGGSIVLSDLTISGGLDRPSVSNSQVGSGVKNAGTVMLQRCLFTGNGLSSGPGQGGSAFFNAGTATVVNCTFTGNFSDSDGAAIGNAGQLTVTSCTIAQNAGNGVPGGIRNRGTAQLANTVVALNNGQFCASGFSGCGQDVYGTFASGGYNFIGNPDGSTGFGSPGSHDQVGVPGQPAANPKLDGLGDNGGPTQTMDSLPGSPLIDQGNSFGLTSDERGFPRPADFPGINNAGDGSDIGAVERGIPQAGPTFTVTSVSEHDDGSCTTDDCTLLEALNATNASSDDNTITFAPGVTGIIPNSLTVGLAITNPVTIAGPGAQILAVAGKSGTRVFNVTGANVRISGLTMKNATSALNGGGIFNSGQLTLTDCVLSNNHTASGGATEIDGGGIYNSAGATLILTRCVLSGNGAQSYGGAVYNAGSLAATDCTLSNSNTVIHGGAIFNNGAAGNATATLTNCTLSLNFANASGGAMFSAAYNSGHSTVTLTNCTLDHNSAGQYGGAVYSDGTGNGNAALTVTNCTFNQNSASIGFGGIAIDGLNPGSTGIATLLIQNTILRSGTSGTNLNNDGGTITSGGHNISNDSAGGDGATGPGGFLNATGDKRNTDPLLDTLKSNGGPTNTLALLGGSPAINAGNDANAPATDQRGYFRSGISDIGAFEFNGVVPLPPTVTTQAATNITSTTATLNATVNPNGITTSVQFTSNFGSFAVQAVGNGSSNVSVSVDVTGLAPNTQYNFNLTATSTAGTTQGVQQSFTTMPPTTLANISTRLRVETGDNALIGGFIVTGTQPKKIIIRGIGPSLGIADQLANPMLELYNGQTLLKANDDWQNSTPADKQAIIDSTIPPTNDLEPAIVTTLPANGAGYTAILRGVNNSTGIGVIQIYDLDRLVDSKLANISTRGFVQTGDNVLFAGMIVVGQASQKVIIRALGPSTGVPGAMADPTLELHDVNGALLEVNDNWVDSPNKQFIIDSTIPPPNNLESAIVRTLTPGNYTAIVRGVNNATGIAVVEVYALN